MSRELPLQEVNFSFARSSGAGGQNVNKVNSKAILRWSIVKSSFLSPEAKSRFFALHKNKITSEGDLVITSEKHRDQGKNVTDCLEKLEDLLEKALAVEAKRVPTKRTRGSQARRIQGKKLAGQKKVSRRRVDY